MEVFTDTFVPTELADWWFRSQPCPACSAESLRPVANLGATQWLCASCGRCWLPTHGYLRAVDPWTLFNHFWHRIEQGPKEIWTFLDRGIAQAQVRASQARWEQGKALGSLDGIPVAVKDMIDVQGLPTTAASATRRHALPALHDAPIVALLRAQGAILMGKTNLSEFAFSGLGINPHFGTPTLRNAEGQECAPGGSSSGGALALAHGMVSLALGTDTSGSVRVPCAWNGLVGLRPSASRYPHGGVLPLAPALDVCGPMARSVADVIWLDAVLAGSGQPTADRAVSSGTPKLWVVEGLWQQDLDAQVERAFEDGLSRLQQCGWVIERRPQATMEAVMDLQAREGMLVSAQAARVHADLLRNPKALALVHAPVRERLLQAQALPAQAEDRLLEARAVLREQWKAEVGLQTLVVIPTTAGVAPLMSPLLAGGGAFSQANFRALRNTLPSSFLDAPSITLPLPGTRNPRLTERMSTLPYSVSACGSRRSKRR